MLRWFSTLLLVIGWILCIAQGSPWSFGFNLKSNHGYRRILPQEQADLTNLFWHGQRNRVEKFGIRPSLGIEFIKNTDYNYQYSIGLNYSVFGYKYDYGVWESAIKIDDPRLDVIIYDNRRFIAHHYIEIPAFAYMNKGSFRFGLGAVPMYLVKSVKKTVQDVKITFSNSRYERINLGLALQGAYLFELNKNVDFCFSAAFQYNSLSISKSPFIENLYSFQIGIGVISDLESYLN
ncbi:hypothetical protein GYB22_04815 [bacterium]|nr:hypothetical protein [bacterium]